MNSVIAQIVAEIGSAQLRDNGVLQLVKSVVTNADKLGISWNLRPGTTVEPDPVDGSTRVIIDGSSTAIPIMSLIGQVPAGVRVMVLISPPAGHHIVGCIDADLGQWYEVDLINGYTNRPGHPPLAFRRLANPPNSVQVIGSLVTGTTAIGIVISSVPEQFRPTTVAAFGISAAYSYGATPHMEIVPNGNVAIFHVDAGEYVYVNAIYQLEL